MKTNVFLATVAAILAVPTVLTIVNEQGSFTRYEDVPRLFDGFTPEKVAAIQLSKVERDEDGNPITGANGKPQREILTLQRTSDGWAIAGNSALRGAPVTKNLVVTNVLQHVEQIRRDEDALIEADASDEQLAEFDLGDEDGVLIQCFDAANKPTVELIKGRAARDAKAGADSLRGHFVRRKDRRDIVLYEQDYWNLMLEPRNWFDRALIPREAATTAVRFRIKNVHGEVEFKKDKPTDVAWQAVKAPEGAGAPRQQEINNLAGKITQAQIADYTRAIAASGPQRQVALQQAKLDQQAAEVEFETEDGTIYTMLVGPKLPDKHEHVAVCSTHNFLITVPGRVKTTMDADVEDLFDPSEDSIRPNKPEDGEKDKPKDGGEAKPSDGGKEEGGGK